MVSPVFAPLIGQPQAIELLSRAISQDRIAPAYLFAGAEGVGRRLAAYCFAELLLSYQSRVTVKAGLAERLRQGNHPDLLWVEPTYLHQGKRLSATEAVEQGLKRKAPPIIRLEQIREITQFLGRPSLEAARAVVVLEQAETMAEGAANALLKTLEEPGRATLILIAPGVESLLPTLVSRCQRIPFRRLSHEDMAQVLRQSGHGEILERPEVLALAQGSPGEAIAHWQQLQSIPPELLATVTQLPRTVRQALELARQISQSLDTEAQLWLLDYLQYYWWNSLHQPTYLKRLETARQQLLSYVQARLVWEVALMEFVSIY